MLQSLARWSYRHRWPMLGIWIAAIVLANVGAGTIGGDYSNDFSLPGTESQAAYDLLKERFPERSGDTADIVFEAEQGVDDPAVQAAMEGYFTEVEQLGHVEGEVESPYEPGGEQNVAPNGRIAFGTVHFDVSADKIPVELIDEMQAGATAAEIDGLNIELGGIAVQFAEFEEPGGAEAIGLLAAMFILLVTFGSVLAMGLPIMMALFGIGIGLAMVLLFARFLNVADFTPQLASMIGIGVGVDYALFIVTRYRQQLHEGMDPEEATVLSIMTSGRAVLFAGTTVVISLLGILLMGFEFVEGVAVGSASTVLVTMLASVTLLPAMLGFVGRKIDKWRLPKFHRQETDEKVSMWFRWSRLIQRRPAPIAAAGLIVLVVLALPLFSIHLGTADAGTGNPDRSSRRAYDLLSEGFGPGFNGPLILAAEIDGAAGLADLQSLQQELSGVEGVAAVTPPFPNQAENAAVMSVYPTTSPQDTATEDLVKRLREVAIPQALEGADTRVLVGGLTAGTIDFSEKNAERLPILIGVVILLSFLLLVAVFRSILVPLKAAIMNLLSIGAAYGVIVAIFQKGWGASLIGVETTAPIEAWVPMMLFTILFGLSMDYEIFLLSRIREDYVRTRDNGLAVANGLAATARVISAAAAIMVTVFLSFVFGFDERAIKLFGMGLAVAIFVDATLVRMVLVPATMELLGNANWWFPRWLDRFVPKISIEPQAAMHEEIEVDPEAEPEKVSTR